MATPVISVIGAGNMGTCLIGGLIRNGHPPDKIFAADISAEKLKTLQDTFPIHTTNDNIQALQNADVVIFAVKPQELAKSARELAATIEKGEYW